MAGYGKRVAATVPQVFRDEMDKLSKATLMEILWDIAVRDTGSEDYAQAIEDIRATNETLKSYR